VHGILIGDRETIGLLEVCDAIHWVRDWRRYASDARRRVCRRLFAGEQPQHYGAVFPERNPALTRRRAADPDQAGRRGLPAHRPAAPASERPCVGARAAVRRRSGALSQARRA
jgi:hypothetical protein